MNRSSSTPGRRGVLGAVLALTVAGTWLAGSAAVGSAPASASGVCSFSVAAAPTVLARQHRHVGRGLWRLAAKVDCLVPHADLRLVADLARNGVSQDSSTATAGCTASSVKVCQQLAATRTSGYSQLAGKWQPRLVVFLRGPTSTYLWTQDHRCVMDIPTFITICTVVGNPITVR